jgi:hypothetical protein
MSCEDTISMDIESEKPYLVIYAFPTENDTISITISETMTTNGTPIKLKVNNISCTINGKDDKITFNDSTSYNGYPIMTYLAIGKHGVGDSIKISVDADNFPSVHGETTIPSKPVFHSADISDVYIFGDTYKQFNYDIGIQQDMPHFAIRVIVQKQYSDDMSYDYTSIKPETNYFLINNEFTKTFDFGLNNSTFHNLLIFSNNPSYGNSISVSLKTYKFSWYDKYMTQFYSLSEEYYSMLKSHCNNKNNEFAKKNLAFTYMTYTNVSGGFGCIGGYNSSYTDWFSEE